MPFKNKQDKAKYQREYYKKNREKRLQQNRRYRNSEKGKRNQKRYDKLRSVHKKKYYEENKEQMRVTTRKCKLKRLYGLTPNDYNKIFESQSGVCLICGNVETRTRKGRPTQLVIDHCHISGKVRGLLCSICNSRLGWYEKCQEKIESYLKNN